MINEKELRNRKLQELAQSEYAKILLDYLNDKIDEMKNVDNAENWKDVLAMKKAKVILQDTFKFLGKLGEKPKENSKNQYL